MRNVTAILAAAGTWAAAMFGSASAWAQPANKAAAETTIPGGTLLIISYGVLWVGLLAFIGYLGWRQRQLYDELDDLERRLEETVDDPSIDE